MSKLKKRRLIHFKKKGKNKTAIVSGEGLDVGYVGGKVVKEESLGHLSAKDFKNLSDNPSEYELDKNLKVVKKKK